MRALSLVLVILTGMQSGVRAQGLVEYGMVTGGAGGTGVGRLSGSIPSSFGGGGGFGSAAGGFAGFGGGGGGGGTGGGGASCAALALENPKTIAGVAALVGQRRVNEVYALHGAQYFHRHDHLTFGECDGMSVDEALSRALSQCPECLPPTTQAALEQEKESGRDVTRVYRAYLNNRSPEDRARLTATR